MKKKEYIIDSKEFKESQESVILYSDASCLKQRFAIVEKDGTPVWHGYFFERIHSQAQAELEAAKKAIWVAAKAGFKQLKLYVDAQWLTTLNGKASVLIYLAEKYQIQFCIEHIPSDENKADVLTYTTGFLRYQESRLFHKVA